MKRRNAVKGIFLFTLGTPLLYSCKNPYDAVHKLNLKSISFTNKELSSIDKLSRIILPIQSIPAFENHTTLPFVMHSFNSLYTEDEKNILQSAYTEFSQFAFDTKSIDINNQDISSMTNWVQELNDKPKIDLKEISNTEDKIKFLIDALKKENLTYFSTTKQYLEKFKYYQMAPGRFNGNFPISELPNPFF